MEALITKREIVERSNAKCPAVENESVIKLRRINEKRNLEKTDIRRNNLLIIGILAFISVCSQAGVADSLWTPEFKGYVTDQARVQIGDVVIVKIDSSFSLAFNSSSKDSKQLTLEFSGGEYGSLFDFLPDVSTGGTRKLDGKEEHKLNAEVVARVTQINPRGQLFIQGTQSLTVEGKEQGITISGWLDPADLGSNKEVAFSKVADSRLIYRSFLQPSMATLTDKDIQAIFQGLSKNVNTTAPTTGPASTGTTATAAPNQTQTTSVTSATASSTEVKLTDEKKRELFLLYVNRLIDILFR